MPIHRQLYPEPPPRLEGPLMYYTDWSHCKTTKERKEQYRSNRRYLIDRIRVGTVMYRWGRPFTVEKVDSRKIFIDGDWLTWSYVQAVVDYGALKFEAPKENEDELPF